MAPKNQTRRYLLTKDKHFENVDNLAIDDFWG